MAEIGRFRALVAEEPGRPARFLEIGEAELGEGEVTIEIAWTSLNYKDALAVTGTAPVVRRYPSTIGIDLAGRVVLGGTSGLLEGEEVLVVGCGLGEEHPGGYSRFARVPAEWCVRLPAGLDTKNAMILGTAGLTAMLACLALERNGAVPSSTELPVLVTGAAGGVGSIAVALLARLGYHVLASTGRPEEAEYLERLGASEVVNRATLQAAGRGPLGAVEFGAAIDVVGGATLAEVLRRVTPNGTVAACGLAGGAELATTVYPLILRGVTLAGVNSVHPPLGTRDIAWQRLADQVSPEVLALLGRAEALGRVADLAPAVLAGQVRGRVVLDVTR